MSEADAFSAWYGGELTGGEARPPAAASPSYALSGWWARVGAVLLDDLVLIVPLVVLIVALHQYHVTHYITIYGTIGTTASVTNGGGFDGLLWLLYAVALLARAGVRNGQTLGKQATHIRVARNDGKPVDLSTVIIREGIGKAVIPGVFFIAIPGLRVLGAIIGLYALVDYLWPLWERENRALHDLFAGTHVIRLDDGSTPRFTPSPR